MQRRTRKRSRHDDHKPTDTVSRKVLYDVFDTPIHYDVDWRDEATTPNQIEFIDLVEQELTKNGVMEADRLYQTPFIDISPQGPDGIFPSARVDQIIQVLSEIRLRAAA